VNRVFLPSTCFGLEEARISGAEHQHLTRSLRVRSGERFLATDGEGREFLLESAGARGRELVARILEESTSPPGAGARLTLAIAPPKGGRMEIAVEKVVECGVGAIVPIRTARSVVQPRESSGRSERWVRVAQSATAQSGRFHLPEIAAVQPLARALEDASSGRILLAHPGSASIPLPDALSGLDGSERVTIFVGPEGGFTEEEIELGRRFGATEVTLGPNRLRTETAAIAAVALAVWVLSVR
jgi:16S rRNA (uracil1498-N3)-methyltransferase